MNIKLSTRSFAATTALVLAGLGMTGAAQARDDVYWSVGLSSPGVQLGFANAPPLMIQQPVFSQPYPFYGEPRTVYRQPPVVYLAPRPIVYVRPAPIYVAPPQYIRAGWDRPGRGWDRRRGHGRHQHDRFEPGRFDGERAGHGRRDHRRD